ncbi:MAG: hypothetical protein ABSA68_14820 [Xanthobacteraceae bacterium]
MLDGSLQSRLVAIYQCKSSASFAQPMRYRKADALRGTGNDGALARKIDEASNWLMLFRLHQLPWLFQLQPKTRSAHAASQYIYT